MSTNEAGQMIVDLGELADYVPYEGLGNPDHFTHDGIFKMKVEKVAFEKSKDRGIPMVAVVGVCTDEDNIGRKIIHRILLAGKDKNGKAQIKQLGEFLTACGADQKTINTTVSGYGKATVEQVATALIKVGTEFYAKLETENVEGKKQSSVRNLVKPEDYATAKAANTHRQAHREIASQTGAPAGFVPTSISGGLGPLPTGNGLGSELGTPTPAPTQGPANGALASADPLAKLGGLGLGARA